MQHEGHSPFKDLTINFNLVLTQIRCKTRVFITAAICRSNTKQAALFPVA